MSRANRTFRARFPGNCGLCGRRYAVGDLISQGIANVVGHGSKYVHVKPGCQAAASAADGVDTTVRIVRRAAP